MPKKVIVLSSAAALSSFRGHSFNYHCAVRDALKLASIEYKVLIPKNNPITVKDDLWELSPQLPTKLVGEISSKILRFFIYTYHSLCITFAWILFYRKFSKNADVIVFYETGGNFLDEALISFALKIIGKKPFAVWYLIRGLPVTKKFQLLLKISIFFAGLFAGKGRLSLCTDTVTLRDNLKIELKSEVTCLPIPHASNISTHNQTIGQIKLDGLKIWGLSCLGENKGEGYLVSLLKNIDRDCKVEVVVRSAFLEKNKIPACSRIETVSNELNAQQFMSLLQNCQVVLLPYFGGLAEAYKLSSSGIFVDSVAAGLLPLVTKDTWMEFELNRFNLNELVVDWSNYNTFSDLCELIEELICAENTMRKLAYMRHSYCAMHSPNGFLEALYQNNFFSTNNFDNGQKKYG